MNIDWIHSLEFGPKGSKEKCAVKPQGGADGREQGAGGACWGRKCSAWSTQARVQTSKGA